MKNASRSNRKLEAITYKTIVVGIDIAKSRQWARFVDYRGMEIGKAVSFNNDREGFEYIVSEIRTKIKTFDAEKVIVGMEPTGHYWKPLANYLMKQNIAVVLVNPYHTKKAKELDDNSQTKSDKKDALTMAKYLDFGFSIGSGTGFSLPNYYRLCEEIVSVLREHNSLLEKHFSRLTPEYYNDQSLHLLAFDLMYCCRTYNFFRVITLPKALKTKRKKATGASLSPEEEECREAERVAKIAELELKINKLERDCDNCSDISLIGVQVTAKPYGIGTVVAQEINNIRVSFGGTEKSYILDRKYVARPRFENDEDIISVFTEYGQKQEKIKRLRRELMILKG